MTARTDLTIPQSTSWSQAWQITGYDLSASTWTPRSQVRRSTRAAEVLHTFACDLDPIDAIVTLTVMPDESAAWDWTSGVYDVQIESADGTALRVSQGSVRVDGSVTRDE